MMKRISALLMALALLTGLVTVPAPQPSTAATNDAKATTSTFKPQHLFADAAKRLEAAESGKKAKLGSFKAAKQPMDADVTYDCLTVDQKLIYTALANLYDRFEPYASADEFHNKATSTGNIDTALADDIASGRVVVTKFTRAYTREEYQEIYEIGAQAYHFDHPYNLASYLYRASFRIKSGTTMYHALTRLSNVQDFDYRQWVNSMIQFENKALSEIVNDERFNETQPAVMEFLVHDYICGRVTYDASKPADNTIQWYKIKSAFGPLVENKGVCIGIARMAKILLDDMGIPTYIVNSNDHAWNMVYLNGAYYEMDCTWDLDYGKGMSYKYYNRTTNELLTLDPSGHHTRNNKSIILPVANGTSYSYEAVCNLIDFPPVVNVDQLPNPTQPTVTDYVDEDIHGETYPNLDDYVYEDMYFDLNSEGFAICKGSTVYNTTQVVPDNVLYTDEEGYDYEYPVYMIDESAFAKDKTVKKVYLGTQIIYIGEKAFYNCKNLKHIYFTGCDYLDTVEKGAFKGIAKKPVFHIGADGEYFDYVKELLKYSGVPKKSKFKSEEFV